METLKINNKTYKIIKLLGKGKSGYSYLVNDENNKSFVIKQIHHEPCNYYSFSNKLEAELNAYKKLKELNINIPTLYEIDINNERILKEYIEGDTIDIYVKNDKMKDEYISQIKDMCKILYINKLNIDYYPTNFVIKNNKVFYIDYEINEYMEEWNFENWGIKFYSKTPEFLKHF